jgi:outer membrane receptor for ferrienterochelin and colicins
MRFVSGLAILMAGIVVLSGGGVAAAHQTAELEKMVVTGTRTKHTLEDVPVETQVITRQDIERSPARNIADILNPCLSRIKKYFYIS